MHSSYEMERKLFWTKYAGVIKILLLFIPYTILLNVIPPLSIVVLGYDKSLAIFGTGVYHIVAFIICTIIAVIITRKELLGDIKNIKKIKYGGVILLCIVGTILPVIPTILIDTYLVDLGTGNAPDFDPIVKIIYGVIGFTFIPVLEETLYRRTVSYVNNKTAQVVYAIVISLFFAVGHVQMEYPDIMRIFQFIIPAIIMLYSYWRNKNLIAPIIIHTANNLLFFIMQFA